MTNENQVALESLGMDINQTLARFVGNEALLTRFLKKLPDDETYGKLLVAMDLGDVEDAFHQAHTLKGVVGNLGLGTLFTAIDPVVEKLRAGDFATAKALFPPVTAAYEQAIAVIATLA